MFGMLSPARASLSYRSTYARCCQHHRRVAGLAGLPWLSYEAVLLYQVAVDAGLVSRADLRAVRCCKLRALPARPAADRDVGRFCAHVGLLLGSVKISDDRRDSAALLPRLLGLFFRRRFDATHDYFARLDPTFRRTVEGFIRAHVDLERRGRPIELNEYVEPTAWAFAHVFRCMSRLPGLGAQADLLGRLGECVGSAIISFDCAVDRDRDRRRGEFNPLADGPEAVGDALRFSLAALERARQSCEAAFGARALTVETLNGVIDRVGSIGRRLACPRCGDEVRRTLQGWGLAQPRGAVQLSSVTGLAGLAALLVGLAGRFMASAPPPAPGGVPAGVGVQPSAVTPGAPAPVPPVAPKPSKGDGCGSVNACDGCDGALCCCETTSCALDNSCDLSACGNCGSGCDGCSGCDCSC
jgi:hypothetical protein